METLQRTANRGSISTGYDIDNSLKFEADNSETLSKTFSSDGNKQTWTVSFWVKRTELSTDQMVFSAGDTYFYFLTSDVARINTRGATNYFFDTSAVFRDTSAWYHFVVRVDTTNSTAADRTRLYVNGVEFSSSTTSYENNTGNTGWNDSAKTHVIGNYTSGSYHLCGYLAEFHSIDGQSLAPTDFGEYDDDSGIWIPKAYDGTYGTNGFYLDFEDSSSLGADDSGNGNNFTLNNITAADQSTDTPTNNFCIGNALVNFGPSTQALTEGGTKFANPSGQNWQSITGTFGLTSGKWYWEFKRNGTGAFVGIADVQDDKIPQNIHGYFLGAQDDNSATTKSLGMYSLNGVIYNDAGTATGSSYTTSQIVGVALDMDNEKIYFAVDNTWANSADPAAGTNGATWNSSWSNTVYPAFSCAQNNNVAVNYGGYTTISISSAASDANGYGNFEYAPPSGYYAICSKNLAEYG